MLPVRIAPVIHVIAAPAMSIILHYVYEHGLIVESVKYNVESRLTDVGFVEPGY